MSEPRPPITQWPRRLIDWLCDSRSDYRDFQERKAGAARRARRSLCLWIWLGAGGLMLVCPGAGCVITLLLGATFLSFAILDEE
jgi:hypothetical protein